MESLATLIDIYKNNSQYKDIGITFISYESDKFVSYKSLFSESLKVLHYMQSLGIEIDDKVVLQITDPYEFILIFWACILGGFIPVPIDVRNNHEHILKVIKIWNILDSKYIITTQDRLDTIIDFAVENSDMKFIDEINNKKILISDIENSNEEGACIETSPEKIAYIQFSSGTTGDPKGIILTHRNLLNNINSIVQGAEFSLNDTFLSWMPLSHDMGLIGYHIIPSALCINHYIMRSRLFIMNPIFWMEKVSEYSASIISSPNFGYQHLLNHIEKIENLKFDLSKIRLIFNGAEPISSDLCTRFLNRMEKYGLKRNSMYPVYGLAEATLAVSFPPVKEEFQTVKLSRESLKVGDAIKELEFNDSKGIEFVDLGYILDGVNVRIVDDNNEIIKDKIIGHIQIKGENVTQGYFRNKDATKNVFTSDGWLNTGDLGFIKNQRLIVTGRFKDIIFINGQNYYSHDLERIAEQVNDIKSGNVVALGVFNEEVQEDDVNIFVIEKQYQLETFSQLALNLKNHIQSHLGIPVKNIIPINKIPKTTSGKIQRNKLKENYLNKNYEIYIFEVNKYIEENLLNKKIIIDDNVDLNEKIMYFIVSTLSKYLKIPYDDINTDSDLFVLGIDSLQLVNLLNDLEKEAGILLSPVKVLEFNTISDLTSYLSDEYFEEFNNLLM